MELLVLRDRIRSKQVGESIIYWRFVRKPGPPMEFTVLFLAAAIVMLIAWRGRRPLAFGLFAAFLIACVATYLHHATDTLKLSF
jgi:CHASE2 domain-containing sensor protein